MEKPGTHDASSFVAAALGSSRWRSAVVWALCVVLFTGALGRLDLFEPDETRHAEIAAEMLAGGGFLTPHLQGKPYYDKPVFYHWEVAASMALFGANETAARLPSALAGLWTLLMAAWFARRVYSRAAADLTVVGLATTACFTAVGRYVLIDMTFTAVLTTAFVWLGLWFVDSERPRSILPVYAITGLAVLIKGPVAVVLVGSVAVIMALSRFGRRGISRLRPLAGFLVGSAVCVPWYLAAWLSDPTYMETFLWTNNVERYLAGGHVGHPHPWYYYAWTMPAALLPWVFLMPAAIRERTKKSVRSPADVYLLVWAAVVVVFFTTANSKIVTYVLPAFPALVCLTAAYVADALSGDRPALPKAAVALCNAWIWVMAFVYLVASAYVFAYLREWSVAVAGIGGVSLLTAMGIRAWRQPDVPTILSMTALTMAIAIVLVFVGPVAQLYNHGFSEAVPAKIIAADLPAGAPVLAYRQGGHAVAFYDGRFVDRIDDIPELTRRLEQSPRAALLVRLRYLDRLGLDPLPPGYEVAWQSIRDDALILKRPVDG